MQKLRDKLRGFTLFELLTAMTIFFVVITMVMKFYVYLVGMKHNLEGRQLLVENSYFMLEKLQVQMKNYTIDYEEYFNRSAVGCDTSPGTSIQDFTRSGGVDGACNEFTQYGNGNSFVTSDPDQHHLYYCSSLLSAEETTPHQIYNAGNDLLKGSGCVQMGQQSFGQYEQQFYDAGMDADTITGAYGDDDDVELGIGPPAIYDADNIHELYFINKDGDRRTFIRRHLVASGNYDLTGGTNLDTEKLYTLEILKLQGFDLGQAHDADTPSTGLYDGRIDTWACDYAGGFICQGNDIATAYSGYKFPQDSDDGWTTLFDNNITLTDFSVSISPTVDPEVGRAMDDVQINPSVQISRQAKLYGRYRAERLPNVEAYTFSIQTTFDTKSFY